MRNAEKWTRNDVNVIALVVVGTVADGSSVVAGAVAPRRLAAPAHKRGRHRMRVVRRLQVGTRRAQAMGPKEGGGRGSAARRCPVRGDSNHGSHSSNRACTKAPNPYPHPCENPTCRHVSAIARYSHLRSIPPTGQRPRATGHPVEHVLMAATGRAVAVAVVVIIIIIICAAAVPWAEKQCAPRTRTRRRPSRRDPSARRWWPAPIPRSRSGCLKPEITSDSKHQSAPDQHEVEHITRRVWGCVGLGNAREIVQK